MAVAVHLTYMQWSVLLATKLTFTKKASQGVYSHRVIGLSGISVYGKFARPAGMWLRACDSFSKCLRYRILTLGMEYAV